MAPPSHKPATAGTADKFAILRRYSLFAQLPSPETQHLGRHMKRRRLPRGTVIFAKGDPDTGLMGVVTGAVKISLRSVDGRDVVISTMHEGDIFGEIALLDGHARSADATAITDCELMVIERRDFIQFLRSQPDLCIRIIELLCSRLRRTTEQVEDLTFLDLPTRLAKALLRLTVDAKGGGSPPKVAITQREISQIIGKSREMTNKQLRSWAKHGLISLERAAVIILDRGKLAEVAAQSSEGDPSRDLPLTAPGRGDTAG